MRIMLALTLAISCWSASGALAQSPLRGFWVRQSISCEPQDRCAQSTGGPNLAALQLAIDVRGESVIISAPTREGILEHVDTFTVDGRVNHWVEGRRGTARDTVIAGESYGISRTTSRRMWPGESWTVSADGRLLTHRYQWWMKGSATATPVAVVYRRSVN